MKALAFGEVLWDIYESDKFIGGATLNFAAHFVKCGGSAHIVTAVGDDSLGAEAVNVIENLGISAEYVSIAERETGKCLVSLNEKGIPSYNLLSDVAYDYIKKPDSKGKPWDILYFGTLALRGDNNKQLIRDIINENSFGNIFVDVNTRAPFYSAEVLKFAMENASVVKISDEELPVVMELIGNTMLSVRECATKLASDYKNLKLVLVTCGDKGACVYDCTNGSFYERDAQKVKLASTVGAGDSFSASFMASYLKGGSIEHSLDVATKVSAFVVSNKDAVPEYDLSMIN